MYDFLFHCFFYWKHLLYTSNIMNQLIIHQLQGIRMSGERPLNAMPTYDPTFFFLYFCILVNVINYIKFYKAESEASKMPHNLFTILSS